MILLNWQDSTLETQIEYGAKIGEIELEAAKNELSNFKRNVIPVAEYFDYKQLLYVVSTANQQEKVLEIHSTSTCGNFQIGGERSPEAIFEDMQTALDHMLESGERLLKPRPESAGSYRHYRYDNDEEDEDYDGGITRAAAFVGVPTGAPSGLTFEGPPMVLWVVGGPGSNKTEKMEEIAGQWPDWKLISVSRLLWQYLNDEFPDGLEDKNVSKPDSQMSGREITANMVRKVVRKGEMVPQVRTSSDGFIQVKL